MDHTDVARRLPGRSDVIAAFGEWPKQAGGTGFGRMLTFFKANPSCRTLLVEKTDRLYRNPRDWVSIDDMKLTIHFVKENVVLAPDARSSEKFMHGIKVLMAKNYIDNLSEEVKKGLNEKAKQSLAGRRARRVFEQSRNTPH